MSATLVIMAAGLASRYGGAKQIEKVGPGGEILMEYTIHDAQRAGFDRFVIILQPQMLEEYISIGTIGLIKAVNSFDNTKGARFATYASRCIENEILMYLRRNSKTKLEVSIDEPLNVDWDGNELLLSDILGTDEDVISRRLEDEVEITLLGKAINKLTPREQTIIRLRFGLNSAEGKEKTQKEVADLLGISQSYISRLEKRIMKRLKKEIVKYE